MNAAEPRIDLIDHCVILFLKCSFPKASRRLHRSANNEIADEMAGAAEFSVHLQITITGQGKREKETKGSESHTFY